MREVLSRYHVVPQRLLGVVATALLLSEPTVGAGLLVWAGPLFSFGACLLFVGFAFSSVATLRTEKKSVDCGCLGSAIRLHVTVVSATANLLVGLLAGIAAVEGFSHDTSVFLLDKPAASIVLLLGFAFAALYWLILYAATIAELMVPDRPAPAWARR
jgi:hypothetical protein